MTAYQISSDFTYVEVKEMNSQLTSLSHFRKKVTNYMKLTYLVYYLVYTKKFSLHPGIYLPSL